MKKHGSFGLVVACAIGAAVLITLLVDGGWTIWPPALLAIGIVCRLRQAIDR